VKHTATYLLSLLCGVILFSTCSKNATPSLGLFYGAWKTSYGDTVLFARENGKNILTYKYSMNPGMPSITKSEFNYRDGKLELKSNFDPTLQFRPVSSFSWVQAGKEFSVQGIEWFNFLSSTAVYFTFTRIL
jgi:hypothetical protein